MMMMMAALCCAGEWLVFSFSHILTAVNIKHHREPFVFDCSKAEQKPKETESDNKGEAGESHAEGSDHIIAVASSVSGNYVALTDDNKRLVLFRTQPSWECISTRRVVRRCTSLVFSQAEEELFVADKSGDVYSFSVLEPQKQGELKLGHLSMLLSITLSPDDKYTITADRDEKIRVSHRTSPYNIQAFCLGHTEFVCALCIPVGHPDWLLSGSGDGTMKVWQYETGRQLQNFDLHDLGFSENTKTEKTPRFAVSRIVSSPDGSHIVVQCESFPAVQVFALDSKCLTPTEKLVLPHNPCDVTFDSQNSLWVLLENEDEERETYIVKYTHSDGHWQRESESADLKRVSAMLHAHWDLFKKSNRTESRFHHLYKVNFDNMASYLQKKHERIQQQNQKGSKKRVKEGKPKSNGATKKSKNTDETKTDTTCDTGS